MTHHDAKTLHSKYKISHKKKRNASKTLKLNKFFGKYSWIQKLNPFKVTIKYSSIDLTEAGKIQTNR